MVVISKKHNWRTGVSIPVPLECESSALPFELVPLAFPKISPLVFWHMAFVLRVFHIAYLSLLLVVNKTSLIFPNTHVRMAERSKAPDSRVELFLTGVFWSTNVGVGSNPTSDKRFSVIEIQMRNRASWCAITNARIIHAQFTRKCAYFIFDFCWNDFFGENQSWRTGASIPVPLAC